MSTTLQFFPESKLVPKIIYIYLHIQNEKETNTHVCIHSLTSFFHHYWKKFCMKNKEVYPPGAKQVES